MKKLLFALILGAALLVLVQPAWAILENPDTINGGWVKKYKPSGDSATQFYGLQVKASTGELFACGKVSRYSGGGNAKMLVAKYSSAGSLLWDSAFGTTGEAKGCWYDYLNDYLYIAGYRDNGSRSQVYKINVSTGDTIYGRLLTSPAQTSNAISGQVGSPSKIYSAGYRSNTSYDACLIRYRDNGASLDTVWTRCIDGDSASSDYYQGVFAPINGAYVYATGYVTLGSGRGQDVLLAKYDSSGNLQWKKTFGSSTTGNYSDVGYACTLADGDSFVYVTGKWYDATGANNMFLMKCRASTGDSVWLKQIKTTGTEEGREVISSRIYNNAIVTGVLYKGARYQLATVKFNTLTGDTIWTRYHLSSGTTGDYGRGLVTNIDNAYVVGYDNTTPSTAEILRYKWLMPQPTLVQPVDSYNTYSTITFKWRNQTYLDSFRIQISTDSLFSTLLVDSLRTTAAPDTQFIFTPAADDTFYWRVKGYDYSGSVQIDSTYWSDRHWVIEDRATPNINASLKADNGDPSPWSGDTIFSISYTTPVDMSGVRRALYKYGATAPTGSYDTSGSATTNPFNVHSSLTRQKLWVWLQDYAGNINYAALRDTVILRYDNTIPGKVTAITADGSNPSPWVNDGVYTINFTSPTDTSGIKRHFTKLGSAPTSAADTSGTKAATKPFTVSYSTYGTSLLYVWEADSAGNSGWANYDTVRLRYDNVLPGAPTSITANGANPSLWTKDTLYTINLTPPSDTSGIGIYLYKLGSVPTSVYDTTGSSWFKPFTVKDKTEGSQTLYIWTQDNAGNGSVGNRGSVALRYDSTAPPAPTNVTANGGNPSPWTSTNSFNIIVTAGDNASGVMRYKTKQGSPPTSPADTSGTYGTSSFTVASTKLGRCTLYVWTQDSANNSNYQNYQTVALRWEGMAPVVTVTSPASGVSWECGAPKTITWTQVDSGVVARDSVQYTIDGRVTWNLIYSGPAGTSNGWTVPNTPAAICEIRVWAKDSVDLWSYGLSGQFTIADTSKPSITVNVPNGGQTWYCGSSNNITFTHSDNEGAVYDSIFYSTNNGTNWNFVFYNTTGGQSYQWSVPNTPSTACRVRIKTIDAAGNWRMDASDAVFTIADSTKPTVVVTSPAGGEAWDINSSHTITWTQGDNAGVAQDSLLYSMDDGASWIFINKIAAGTGYAWTLPNSFSKQARVKVVAIDGSGNKQESVSNLFSINDPTAPTLAVNAPNGGENWQALTSQSIGWAQSDNFGVVTDSIYYSTNSGSSWTPVWGGATTTSYLWSVPNPPATTCRVKVVAIDGYGNRTEDASNADFVISASTINITVTSPNGGQSFTPGATTYITWSQSANVTSDTVLLSTDGGSAWSVLWGGAAATSYGWTIPNTPSAQCRIKVIAVENASNKASDVSDANFTILDIDAPTVFVTSPNGGESWTAGSGQVITWAQNDNVAVIGDSLWYTLNDGGTWTLLYAGAPKTSHDWTLPLITSTACRVQVAAWDASGNRTVTPSLNTFSIVDALAPTVTLEYPIGGESFGIGSNITVSWTQGDNIGVTVDSLELSTDGGSTYSLLWTGLGTSYDWTVPNSPSTQCRMRIVARDGAGNAATYYSGIFIIADDGNPVVALDAPLGGETWYCGGTGNVSWTQNDNVGVTIDSVFLSTDEGATWNSIYGGPATTGFGMSVPLLNTTRAKVLVCGYDAAGNLGADTSGLFTISDSTKPTVTLISPNGGQSIGGGNIYTVSWSRNDNDTIVVDSLEYSTDGGGNWTYVWCGTQSGTFGSYDWTVPNTPSTSCLVKAHVRDEAGNTASDGSNAVFTITAATFPQLAASPDSISIPPAGAVDTIAVTNTGNTDVINYTVSRDSAWITLSTANGSTPGQFTITAGPNGTGFDRTGYVTVTATGIAGSPQLIKVVQPSIDVTNPVVTVTAPNGGEVWDIGSSHSIAWDQSDNVGVTVDSLAYSTDGGSTWTQLWSGAVADNMYSWTVPGTPTANALVKVVARDAAGNRTEDFSDAVFTIRDNAPPTLAITSPTAGATWYAGTNRNITWTQNDNIGVTGDSVSYNVAGGAWTTIYAGAPTTSCSWTLPNIHTASCTVKVVARDAAGNRTPQTVAISVLDTIKPTVTVAAPNGGESYGIGVGVTISWTQGDNIRVMKDSLYYTTDNGTSWDTVAGVTGATSYAWTVPATPSASCRVKVVAIDTAGNKAEDVSNNPFTISAATSPYLAVDRDTIMVGWAGGNYIINATNTGDGTVITYTIAADSAWVQPSDTGGSTPGSFMIDIPGNTSGSARIGHVVVDTVGGGSARTITITQEGHDITTPTVAMIWPNGGETLGIGTAQTLSWSQSDNIGVTLDSLFFSGDGGTNYNCIWTGTDTTYDCIIPNEPTTAGLLKVVAYDAAGNRSEDVSDGTFTIRDMQAPTVTVTAPNGGETWSTGSSRNITWSQSDDVGVAADSVHYSLDNGATWIPLYGGAATTSYSWTIPGVNSSQCLVRVTAYDLPFSGLQNSASDVSDGAFIIRDTIPPTVALTAPNGGQTLMGSGSYEVRWNKGDNIGVVQDSLLYTTNGGASWAFIWKGLSATGSYSWTVPNTPSTACRVKAVVKDEAGNGAEDASDANFTITETSLPYLTVTPLSWNAPAVAGSFYARVTNTGNTSVIAYATTADSSWIVPTGGGTTPDSFLVTVTANTSGATRTGHVSVTASGTPGSPQEITITQPSQDATAPVDTVTTPNGGEAWVIGSSHYINWVQHDDVGVTADSVFYSINNGGSWNFIWSGLNTSYNWTVPSTPSAQCLVKVVCLDASGKRNEDQSDAVFTIADTTKPAVTVTSPNGGEVWNTGTAYSVTWTQSDNIGVTYDSIFYSADNGVSWIPVYGGAATNSYSWTIPGTPTATGLARVVAIDAAGNRTADASNAVFSINDNVAPTVALTSPNGGESWAAGSVHAITWTQNDNAAVVTDSLFFSSDSMTTWSPVAAIPAASAYNWTVPAVVSGACFVRVVAADAANNKASDLSNAKFAINVPDTEQPRLYTSESDTARMTFGLAFNFKVKAADNRSVKKVQLAFGDAGYAVLFDSVGMYSMGDTSYFYPLPDSRIPRHGLQYRITATDSAGNSTVHPASGFYYHQVNSGQLAVSYPSNKWRMVSFPTSAAGTGVYNLLQDDLGSYDKTKWRLYEYRTNAYVEYSATSGITNQPGRAYWLQQRVGPSTTIDLDSVASTAPAGGAVNVALVNGWVDVGDPYLYNVKWGDIRAATGADTGLIQVVWTYDGNDWVLVGPGSTMLPWQGYSIRANGSGTLRIPALVATKGPAKSDGLWPTGWIGTITVSNGQGRDNNYFGIGEGTSAAADKYDYPEPPSGLTGVSGYFMVGDMQCAADLRPALGAGQTWEFAAMSQQGANTISVPPVAGLPKGNKIFLADLSDQLTQELTAGGQYEYRASGGDEKRGFKLIVGSDAYVQGEIDRAFVAPSVTLLNQNRPNPVSAKTLISYQLAQGGKVELAVYNIVGQKVKTLVSGTQKAGKYRVTWDGSNDDNKRLSNGVYFYRLNAADAVQTKKLTIVR